MHRVSDEGIQYGEQHRGRRWGKEKMSMVPKGEAKDSTLKKRVVLKIDTKSERLTD